MMNNRRFSALLVAGALSALSAGSGVAQDTTVTIVPPAATTILNMVTAGIDNEQVNGVPVLAPVLNIPGPNGIFFNGGGILNGAVVEINDNTISSRAIGNNAINLIVVGDVLGVPVITCSPILNCVGIFVPADADIHIGSAQLNFGGATISAAVDGAEIGALFGDPLGILATTGSDVEVNDNTTRAIAIGNRVLNGIVGDFSILPSSGTGFPATSSTDAAAGVATVTGNIAIVNGQVNDDTAVTATLGDGTPTIGAFDNFTGIQSISDVDGNEGFDVLRNSMVAAGTGNDALNVIGGILDGDPHSATIANLQINQNGSSVTATAQNAGIGILQTGTFTDTLARVSGNSIGTQAIGNNAVNIIGGPAFGQPVVDEAVIIGGGPLP